MELLKKTDDLEFKLAKEFDYKYLEPILRNMLWKLKNEWDDYNELYHCCGLLENIRKLDEAWIDTHIIEKNDDIVGVVLILGGKIDFNRYLKVKLDTNTLNEKNVMLNYFHIAPEARGQGEKWLRQIIIPYYKNKGVKNIFLKSSHGKSFSLYKRLGTEIGHYTTHSDNDLYNRQGEAFQLEI